MDNLWYHKDIDKLVEEPFSYCIYKVLKNKYKTKRTLMNFIGNTTELENFKKY